MKRAHAFNTTGQAFARPARRTQGTCGVAFNPAIDTKDSAPQMRDSRLSAKSFLIILSLSDAEKLQPALRVQAWVDDPFPPSRRAIIAARKFGLGAADQTPAIGVDAA